jgi:hypothetical protein
MSVENRVPKDYSVDPVWTLWDESEPPLLLLVSARHGEVLTKAHELGLPESRIVIRMLSNLSWRTTT